MISKPMLPPKAGYVEVEVNGIRQYRKIDDSGDRLAVLEEENKMLKAQVAAQSDQMDFYEECIVEMAAIVYA